MVRKATEKYDFLPAPEAGQNPYIGIMSFQHFRGEKMYSDIVVLPENKLTETERVEVYPPSPDAEEKGREQGYYPDTSIAYIRILWKEFEPRQGEYNYAFVDRIIEEAKAHNQSLIFRLMPHSTRAEDDVPDWLKELIPCPERPPRKRVKDSPTDPLFLELFLKAVQKLGERYDSDPTFDAIDISLPGSWGEGHKLELYPEDTLERIVDTYVEAFPQTQLMSQLTRPELIHYGRDRKPIGWRGDGLGNPPHTEVRYPPLIAKLSGIWKEAPVSFEAYWWMCEWQRKGWDVDQVIEKTLEWHISSFNPKSMPIPEEWREKVEYWLSRMGYHFAVKSVACPKEATPGDEMEFEIAVENTGVAPIYKDLPFKLRLSSEKTTILETDIRIRDWFPGESLSKTNVTLPKDLKPGVYELSFGVQNEQVPMLYFATDAPLKDGFYSVAQIEIL